MYVILPVYSSVKSFPTKSWGADDKRKIVLMQFTAWANMSLLLAETKSSIFFLIASTFYLGFAGERVKKRASHFKCLRWQRNTFVAVSTLPSSYGLGRTGVDMFVTNLQIFELSQMFILNPCSLRP